MGRPTWSGLHRRALTAQGGVHAVVGCLAILVVVTSWLAIETARKSNVDEVFGDADLVAHQLASQTTEVLDRVDQTLLFIKYLSEHERLPPLRELRSGHVLANEVTRDVLLADRRGFITDSTSDLMALNVADEEDFKRHKRLGEPAVVIGTTAPSALAGGWGMPVSRRLLANDGSFNGIVSASVDPASLTASFAKGTVAGSVISLVGLDGTVRSRLGGGVVSHGEKIGIDLLQRRAREIRISRMPNASPIDGVSRFFSTVPVPGYPLLAVVAIDADLALEPFRMARKRALFWSACLLALLLAADIALTLQARKLDRSRARGRLAERRFRTMLEGSRDSVVFLQAQRDAAGKVVDFGVTDVNARGAALIGLRPDQVLGRSLCTLMPTVRDSKLIGNFAKLVASGRAGEATVLATDPPVVGRWLHHQVVPIDDGLALITRDVTEERQSRDALDSLSRLDPLTGLANRRQVEHDLMQARIKAIRSGAPLAQMFIDLDGFKLVNDQLGHAAGDLILIEVGRRLRDGVRAGDVVGRLGGDEFIVVMEQAGSQANVQELCERLLKALSRPHSLAGGEVMATPSIGVALFDGSESAEVFRQRADAAMYQAKRAGKGCYRMATATATATSVAVPVRLPEAA